MRNKNVIKQLNKKKIRAILIKEIDSFKNNLKLIKKNKMLVTSFFVSLLLILITFIYLALTIKPVGFEIPIRYSTYSKIPGPWYSLYQIPLTGLIIILFNSLIAVKYFHTEKIISYILMLFGILLSLMVLIQASLFIYLIGTK